MLFEIYLPIIDFDLALSIINLPVNLERVTIEHEILARIQSHADIAVISATATALRVDSVGDAQCPERHSWRLQNIQKHLISLRLFFLRRVSQLHPEHILDVASAGIIEWAHHHGRQHEREWEHVLPRFYTAMEIN